MEDKNWKESLDDQLEKYRIIQAEAITVRENDRKIIKNLFQNFYNRNINVGIGFQRAHGAILAGDFFDMIQLPDGNYLFIFVDVSGHGLPAYTTLVRLRSAITVTVRESGVYYDGHSPIDSDALVNTINRRFTDIMDYSQSDDFACVNYCFIKNIDSEYIVRFYNRSMLFPIVVRRYSDFSVEIINLNRAHSDWFPEKGYLLGSDLRRLLEQNYMNSPSCEFVLHERDSILFYSDGITEAYDSQITKTEFEDERIEKLLLENHHLPPQLVINLLFETVYNFIGDPGKQKDDMTAVLINLPGV